MKIRNCMLAIFFLIVLICCSSCAKKVDTNVVAVNNEKQESSGEDEYDDEDEIISETKSDFIIEEIDSSDVSGDLYKITLARINDLNHIIGEPVYVTKDDFMKYKNIKVSLIGDSIAELSKTYLNRCFNNLVQDSVPGREMEKGIKAFDEMQEIDRVGDIMILSLGNNAMKGIELSVLEYVYESIEGRPLIIPTIVMPYVGQERNRNRDLINFVNSHDNCYIADWNKVARMRDDFIGEDGVHPTDAGCAAYAQLMLKTVADIMKSKNQ